MLQMDGVSSLDGWSVSISAEHQTGNSIHDMHACMDTTGSTWNMRVTVYCNVHYCSSAGDADADNDGDDGGVTEEEDFGTNSNPNEKS